MDVVDCYRCVAIEEWSSDSNLTLYKPVTFRSFFSYPVLKMEGMNEQKVAVEWIVLIRILEVPGSVVLSISVFS
jgi:hypothetical protein